MADLYDARTGRRIELPRKRGSGQDSGGPEDPGLEARLASLEENVEEMRSILARIEPVLTRIRDDTTEAKGRLTHMPSMLQIGGVMLAINAGIVGVAALLVNLLRP